jgi:hypothetical protein
VNVLEMLMLYCIQNAVFWHENTIFCLEDLKFTKNAKKIRTAIIIRHSASEYGFKNFDN